MRGAYLPPDPRENLTLSKEPQKKDPDFEPPNDGVVSSGVALLRDSSLAHPTRCEVKPSPKVLPMITSASGLMSLISGFPPGSKSEEEKVPTMPKAINPKITAALQEERTELEVHIIDNE
ncbi:hypothetical protein RUM44_001257 [Polyplax serrata]|uniref:Uncharacterized protein n=1 Tax=Polyplax serrata TaxID=468196 RepID=A0ABR1AJJ8_POLSC